MKVLFLSLVIAVAYGQLLNENGTTGFIDIGDGNKLFYWLFNCRNTSAENAPLIIWLEGGPGCSSIISIFSENGPYRFDAHDNLFRNNESWNNNAYLLYIDQPLGTGYSNCSDPSLIPEDEEAAYQHFLIFLQKFLSNHTDMQQRDLYVTGHSYGGHYVPYFASKIMDLQMTDKALPLYLKGVAIGNGFFKGSTQSLAYTQFNWDHGLITNPISYVASSIVYHLLDIFAKIGWHREAGFFFDLGRQISNGHVPRFNMYNINMKTPGYNRTYLDRLAQNATYRKSIGVGDINWVSCSQAVYMRMLDKDFYADMTPYFQKLVSNKSIKVMLYSGEYDWICCTDGVIQYLKEIPWDGKEEFMKMEWMPYKINETSGEGEAGTYKEVGNFSFYKVFNAGHMITVERPKVGTYLVKKLIGLIQ